MYSVFGSSFPVVSILYFENRFTFSLQPSFTIPSEIGFRFQPFSNHPHYRPLLSNSKTMDPKMLIWLFPLIALGEAGPAMTGLGGGLDALKQVIPYCGWHQCTLAVLNCIVRCVSFREECEKEAGGGSVKAMTMRCLIQRSVGTHCATPLDTFIDRGDCMYSREDFQVKETGCTRVNNRPPNAASCCSGKAAYRQGNTNDLTCLAEGDSIPLHPHFVLEIQTFQASNNMICSRPHGHASVPCVVQWKWGQLKRENNRDYPDWATSSMVTYNTTGDDGGSTGAGKFALLIDENMQRYFNEGKRVFLHYALGYVYTSNIGESLIYAAYGEKVFTTNDMRDSSKLYTGQQVDYNNVATFTTTFKFYYTELAIIQ